METVRIDKDITVFYVTAETFPAGVLDAHHNLQAMVPFSRNRKYFGISRPGNNGGIVYRAATEEVTAGEGKQYNCETLMLKKGNYIIITVADYREDLERIKMAFQKLLAHPDLDPHGYCVEWYMTDKEEVKCMVRLNN
jgi:hypothetical protein